MPENHGGLGQCVDDGSEILELRLERIRVLVSAPASPAAVDRDHGEAIDELLLEKPEGGAVRRSSVDEHDRRAETYDAIREIDRSGRHRQPATSKGSRTMNVTIGGAMKVEKAREDAVSPLAVGVVGDLEAGGLVRMPVWSRCLASGRGDTRYGASPR